MATRTLQQIISELSPTFKPQIKSLEQRAQLIPGQIQAEESALGAQKDQAYEDIVSGARRRGLGFSGVPLGEQAKYAATDYAPALARLRQSGQERAYSLQDAILGINERRDTLGQQIYQTEQDRAAQERARAAQAQAQATYNDLLRRQQAAAQKSSQDVQYKYDQTGQIVGGQTPYQSFQTDYGNQLQSKQDNPRENGIFAEVADGFQRFSQDSAKRFLENEQRKRSNDWSAYLPGRGIFW
jgi:hypothetical protein